MNIQYLILFGLVFLIIIYSLARIAYILKDINFKLYVINRNFDKEFKEYFEKFVRGYRQFLIKINHPANAHPPDSETSPVISCCVAFHV